MILNTMNVVMKVESAFPCVGMSSTHTKDYIQTDSQPDIKRQQTDDTIVKR